MNGNVIYLGPQYGGGTDPEFDSIYGAPGFETHIYKIPGGSIRDGSAEIVISEPVLGIRMCELAVTGENKNK